MKNLLTLSLNIAWKKKERWLLFFYVRFTIYIFLPAFTTGRYLLYHYSNSWVVIIMIINSVPHFRPFLVFYHWGGRGNDREEEPWCAVPVEPSSIIISYSKITNTIQRPFPAFSTSDIMRTPSCSDTCSNFFDQFLGSRSYSSCLSPSPSSIRCQYKTKAFPNALHLSLMLSPCSILPRQTLMF